ncbi:MAG: hypothetical protein AAGU74_02855 [Bacillota bacterium]
MIDRGAILCIIDGMTDEEFDILQLPHLYSAMRRGAYGSFRTVPGGFAPESYPCIASLLGIPGHELPRRARGYLEAIGEGIAVAKDDLILRGSWMRVDCGGRICGVSERAPSFSPPEQVSYYSLGGYKAVLILTGTASLDTPVTVPPYAAIGKLVEDILPIGNEVLQKVAHQSLMQDTVLLPWGESALCALPPFRFRAAAIAAAPIVKGLCRAMDIAVHTDPEFTADTDTDLSLKTEQALALVRVNPITILHIEGADEAAHRRNSGQKRAFLRKVDDEVIARLCGSGCTVLFCSDHGTSPATGEHLGGAQPFVLVGTDRKGDLGLLPASAATELLKDTVANRFG